MTAQSIAAALMANADALYAGSMTYQALRTANAALWAEADRLGLSNDVSAILQQAR